jgi:glycosyltransferase involved in cell wall biosynthesis
LEAGTGRSADVDVSVVVPAYNGASTITACLASVLRSLEGWRGELIVVDSGTDGTAELVRREFPGVRLIRSQTRLSAGLARNRGIAAARGRLICFTDQDCVVPADWIGRLAAVLEDESLAGVGGSVGIRNRNSPSGCALYFLEFLNHFPGRRAPLRNPLFLVGCNSMYRREVLQRVRFPDQTLGEDVLFAHALVAAGYATEQHAQIEVLHENRSGWRTFFDYNRRMGETSAAYHAVLRLDWALPFLRVPILAFAAPLAVLPSIGFDLLRAPPGYLRRFLLLLPLCLLGNLMWAAGFRRQALRLRSAGSAGALHRHHSASVTAPAESAEKAVAAAPK